MMTSDHMADAPITEKEWQNNKDYWKRKIEELDKNISIFRKKIVEQKRSVGGVNAGQESQSALNK